MKRNIKSYKIIVSISICFLMFSFIAQDVYATKVSMYSFEEKTFDRSSLLFLDGPGDIGKYWAILICGSDDFYIGFQTDIQGWYDLLKNELNYDEDRIYYVAPSNWDGAIHYYSLSKNNIKKAIEDVAARSSENDSVFFFYTAHGTYDQGSGEYYIAPNVYPNELDDWLDEIDPCWLYGEPRKCEQLVVVIQSCYSGNLLESLAYHEAYPIGIAHRHRIIILSADKTSKSWEDMSGYGDPHKGAIWDPNSPNDDGVNNPINNSWDGSEFSSGLRMAFRDTDNGGYFEADDNPYINNPGKSPDITAPFGNKDGRVPIKEAFNFAKFEDCYSVYWESYVKNQGWKLEYPNMWDALSWGDPNGIDPAKTYIYTLSPNKPAKPSGLSRGKVGTSYSYTTSTTDPDGDKVYYWFDWGDETNSGWIGPNNSGQTISSSHTWSNQGYYNIKVKAKDLHDVESEWSDLFVVTMPRNKIKTKTYFMRFLENNLNLFSKLRDILKLQ